MKLPFLFSCSNLWRHFTIFFHLNWLFELNIFISNLVLKPHNFSAKTTILFVKTSPDTNIAWSYIITLQEIFAMQEIMLNCLLTIFNWSTSFFTKVASSRKLVIREKMLLGQHGEKGRNVRFTSFTFLILGTTISTSWTFAIMHWPVHCDTNHW